MKIRNGTADIAKYYPKSVAESLDFKELANAENPEIHILWEIVQKILDNQYIDSASEYGVKEWEKMLDIINKTDESLEDRKFRIMAILLKSLPFTERKLEEMLTGIVGAGEFKIIKNYSDYHIDIKVSLGVKKQRKVIVELLDRILPKNLGYTVDLLYNRHKDLRRYTHGSMRQWTHHTLHEEVLD